ncbi:MAG: caspase family protein [Nannocystis sp.]|nr:caspase family protein [Nannocystis sp.]MBA3550585.1 caspase family protein [Nannocystis sp.]
MKPVIVAALAGMFALTAPVVRAAEPEAAPATRRIALIVGANDGGPSRVKLRYAGTDARSLARVLVEIGGLERADEIVLLEPTQAQLLVGFARAQAAVKAAQAGGERVQFLFYYSGHADERGLLLGNDRVDYARLRGLIHGVPAQVRLGMLDSCSSGAFVRSKGGRMRPPLATGGDASVEGHAFLTSSSAEEAAQESDRIGGSFFTHYLISGLRGAADVNRDRRITLNEAYRFAFDETLASTETTPGRAQHAAYDIQLVGTGDLVMTDLRETSALLDIGPSIGGRVYIRDARGALAAELYKGIGAGPVSIALEPGRYQIVLDDGTSLSRASLEVRAGRKNELTRQDLAILTLDPTTSRGGPEPTPDPDEYRVIPFAFGLVPSVTTNNREKHRKVINRGAFNLLLGRAHRIHGFELSTGGNWTLEQMRGVQLSIAANIVGGDVHGYQASAGVNVVRGGLRGVQAATGLNLVLGHGAGLQVSGVNVVGGELRGMQAGVINWGKRVHGVQLAPLNTAREIRGAQLGALNVAAKGVRGAQVGILNMAEEADAQVGLLSITRKGGVQADVWTSDVAAFNVAVKFRARYTYSMLTIGVHPGGAGRGVMFGIGFGGHIALPQRFHLDLDLTSYSVFPHFVFSGENAALGTLRLLLGYRFARRFAIFGGPTANAYFDFAAERQRLGYGWISGRVAIDSTVGASFWPGFALGIQI